MPGMRDRNHPRHQHNVATLIPGRPLVEHAPINPTPSGRAGNQLLKVIGQTVEQ